MTVAEVRLWGKTIAAVSWDKQKEYAYFEYDSNFAKSNIQVAPLTMPLSNEIFSFPGLNKATFWGLPGLLSDALPDNFGNKLINKWLELQGRKIKSFNPVERLCYVGARGMGALEFYPNVKLNGKKSQKIEIDSLVKLASDILIERDRVSTSFSEREREKGMLEILQVGTSAGGARAKAVISWNEKTNEVRSGQVKQADGFSHWLLKFDGVKGNKDKEMEDPSDYGLIEYAYYKMAISAGIEMSKSRLLTENGRNHFMTKRFDRTDKGDKLHMLSLCGMKHYDFNDAGAYSYEQAMLTMRELDLSISSLEEQFRRMVFNIIARNQDDHVKNISFLMNKSGTWYLSPAYDVTYSYNPDGLWTNQHQMTMNGKRDNFDLNDFIAFTETVSMSKSSALKVIEEVQTAIGKWEDHAIAANISKSIIRNIQKTHRKIL